MLTSKVLKERKNLALRDDNMVTDLHNPNVYMLFCLTMLRVFTVNLFICHLKNDSLEPLCPPQSCLFTKDILIFASHSHAVTVFH